MTIAAEPLTKDTTQCTTRFGRRDETLVLPDLASTVCIWPVLMDCMHMHGIMVSPARRRIWLTSSRCACRP